MTARTRTDLRRATTLLLIGVFVGGGCASASSQSTQPAGGSQDVSTGTPSGSHVAVAQASPHPRGEASGIAGQAVEVVCGGENTGDRECPQHPVFATIDVLRLPSQHRIASVRTDRAGHFRVEVPAGAYELLAHTSNLLIWAQPVTARVPPHQVKQTLVKFLPRHPLPVAPGSASG